MAFHLFFLDSLCSLVVCRHDSGRCHSFLPFSIYVLSFISNVKDSQWLSKRLVLMSFNFTNYGKGKWKLLPGIEEITKGTGTHKHTGVFVVCSQTFTFFRLRKTAVPVEISRFSFRVFVCACPFRDLFNSC